MKTKIIMAGLAGLLVAGGSLAGEGKTESRTSGNGSSYVVTSSGTGDEGVRVVLSGEGGGNVVFVSGQDGQETKSLRMQANDGRVIFETDADDERPWLGVLLNFGEEGVEVESVMEGSPAEQAGLQVGDVIVRADGRDMTGKPDNGGLLADKKPGDRVRFTVLRDGREETLRVRLGSHPGRVEFEIDEALGAFGMAGNLLGNLGTLKNLESLKSLESLRGLSMLPFFDCDDDDAPCAPTFFSLAGGSKPRLGVVLEGLSPQLAEFFEVKSGEGMLVKDVLEGSVAERAGLRAGDVLMRIDDTEIAALSDVRASLKDVEKGRSVRVEVVRRGVREIFRVELDSDPNPTPGYRFQVETAPKSEGDQGALKRYQGAIELARQARVSASGDRDEALRQREQAERQALEEALAAARSQGESGEASRTF